jgi:hypothetical protein
VIDAGGIPLGVVAAGANRRDDGLLAATLDTLGVVGVLPERPVVHLDAGYDWQTCRQVLAERRMVGEIATRGMPAPDSGGPTLAGGAYPRLGKPVRQAALVHERRRVVVEFWLALATAAMVCGRLLRRAWTSHRWDGRPRRRP